MKKLFYIFAIFLLLGSMSCNFSYVRTKSQPAQKNYEKAGSHFIEGNVFASQGKYEKAIAEYTKAINLYSGWRENQARSYNNRGISHTELGNCTKGIGDFTRAIALAEEKQTRASAYHNRGVTYGKLKTPAIAKANADFRSSKALGGVKNTVPSKAVCKE